MAPSFLFSFLTVVYSGRHWIVCYRCDFGPAGGNLPLQCKESIENSPRRISKCWHRKQMTASKQCPFGEELITEPPFYRQFPVSEEVSRRALNVKIAKTRMDLISFTSCNESTDPVLLFRSPFEVS